MLVVTAAVILGLFHSVGHTSTGPTPLGSAIDFSLGMLLILFGFGETLAYARSRFWGTQSAGKASDETTAEAGHEGLSGAALLGVVLMATNITSLALFLRP